MIDPNDPVAVLNALRDVRRNLIFGQAATEVEYRAPNGVSRRIRYAPADLAVVTREIERLQNLGTASRTQVVRSTKGW
jgi:hypothetical protein